MLSWSNLPFPISDLLRREYLFIGVVSTVLHSIRRNWERGILWFSAALRSLRRGVFSLLAINRFCPFPLSLSLRVWNLILFEMNSCYNIQHFSLSIEPSFIPCIVLLPNNWNNLIRFILIYDTDMLSHFVLLLPPSRLLRSIDACSTEKERERERERERVPRFLPNIGYRLKSQSHPSM